MRQMAEFVGRKLQWTQPSALKMEYELCADEELVATLRFKSSFGSLATAESAEGCWTFKRVGFFRTHVTIRACGTDTELAIFRPNTWSSGGTLELPDGRKYLASTNFWQTKYDFRTENGDALIHFEKIGGLLHMSAAVEITPQAISVRELPWLSALGWYLSVMLHMDSAAVAAAA